MRPTHGASSRFTALCSLSSVLPLKLLVLKKQECSRTRKKGRKRETGRFFANESERERARRVVGDKKRKEKIRRSIKKL